MQGSQKKKKRVLWSHLGYVNTYNTTEDSAASWHLYKSLSVNTTTVFVLPLLTHAWSSMIGSGFKQATTFKKKKREKSRIFPGLSGSIIYFCPSNEKVYSTLQNVHIEIVI